MREKTRIRPAAVATPSTIRIITTRRAPWNGRRAIDRSDISATRISWAGGLSSGRSTAGRCSNQSLGRGLQVDNKSGTLARAFAEGANGPAMHFDDRLADREPQPKTFPTDASLL